SGRESGSSSEPSQGTPGYCGNRKGEVRAAPWSRTIAMAEEKKGKAEETAEKTGEVVGKGVKKGWGVVKGVGKGVKEGVKGEEEK
ncbi:MAG TPA: hypothetical protein VEH08_03280, partial [Methanomassiliicoccales archaeon]|nr:hypothetical protein [Methanomassiliicoccales archaeon]